MKSLLVLLFSTCVLTISAQTTFTCTSATTVCPCGAGGALAQYYSGYFADNQSYFTTNTPGITRNDASINFTADNSWGAIVPPASNTNAQPETYSTRWSGRIYLAAGTYTFWLTSDDASWFWLGGSALAANPTNATAFINNGGLHSAVTVSAAAIFTSNCLQDFKVHFGENTGQNRCNLEYASASLGIARSAISGSAFCPCMSNATLPITLSNFYALANKDNVTIYWKTDTEKDNALFKLYKSGDGIHWSVLGERAGSGTTHTRKSYSMADNMPLPGMNYYYLEQIDTDGSSERFDPVWVDFSKTGDYLQLFPNPFQDKVTIVATTEWNDSDVLEIYNTMGKQINLPITQLDKYKLEINTEALPKGNYIIKIKGAYQVIVKRLMKN